jgi:glycosyltransferase involved in cell wall biosynthesis
MTDSPRGEQPVADVSTSVGFAVPCYNEASRLDVAAFVRFAQANPNIRLCFVDDGSSDGTSDVLERFRACAPNCCVLRLPTNVGKGEAVRRGILALLETGICPLVGYVDADLATPLEQLPLLLSVFAERPTAAVAFGSRVKLLGRVIERWPLRHYFGRVFATTASMILRLPVYDTQCGAKVFRASVAAGVFGTPFLSRWVFDVEVFARLVQAIGRERSQIDLVEVPLTEWRDRGDSRLRPTHLFRIPIDLIRIAWRYRAS